MQRCALGRHRVHPQSGSAWAVRTDNHRKGAFELSNLSLWRIRPAGDRKSPMHGSRLLENVPVRAAIPKTVMKIINLLLLLIVD